MMEQPAEFNIILSAFLKKYAGANISEPIPHP
jgi:hypothetical protein